MVFKKKFLNLLFFLALPYFIGAIGAFFTYKAINSWYIYLKKPSFAPPNFVFAPVWLVLYFLMGLASYLVWQKKNHKSESLLKIYFLHLFLNLLWSILFFGLKSPLLGFIEIILLWVFVLFLTPNFYRVNKASGLIFYLYLLWVSFAGILNFSILVLN